MPVTTFGAMMTTLPASQPDQTTPAETGAATPTGYDVLARICADTRKEVAQRKALLSKETLINRIRDLPAPRGFGQALKDAVLQGGYGLITEIKKASPSGGLIRPNFNPAELAKAYQLGGATCLSVLTDGPYFQGDPDHLVAARAAVSLPVLRKDFILDPWQIYESRAMGADCILLIMAALTDDEARELEETARHLDLDVLAEVHDEAELDRALALQTGLIGINNRNLKTLKTDLSTTLNIAPLLPPDRFLVAESGIRTHEDIQRLAATGVRSFLVGESLMRQQDVTKAVRELIGIDSSSPVPPIA
ncbi:Indole-3-glycerol phosphate synthase [Granulibacter bethesdensis]|nr:Indole-3-glycerol phosphate synthase [Granulibacter bethesdensis CGDNIH4]APH59146.1 Indole-3-glycerol phosphate synthase [Granulibacter bethesdensis]